MNTPGKGEDGKLHTPTHELTNPEQPKEEVAFWIWRARAKLETKLKTSTPLSSHRFFSYADPAVSFLSLSLSLSLAHAEELTMTYEYEWKEAPPPPPEKPPLSAEYQKALETKKRKAEAKRKITKLGLLSLSI